MSEIREVRGERIESNGGRRCEAPPAGAEGADGDVASPLSDDPPRCARSWTELNAELETCRARTR